MAEALIAQRHRTAKGKDGYARDDAVSLVSFIIIIGGVLCDPSYSRYMSYKTTNDITQASKLITKLSV